MAEPSKKIDCINILLNTGWWEKDDDLVQKLDVNKIYLKVSDGDLWLTDGTTSVAVADYATITVQTYDEDGNEGVVYT